MSTQAARVVAAYRAWRQGGPFTDLEARLEDLATEATAPDMAKPLTTSEAARVLGVSPRTVAKLVDTGTLAGWKVNKDRRVPVASLRDYMAAQGIPPGRLDAYLAGRLEA